MQSFPHVGEIFALLAPLSWSFSLILFRLGGRTIPPLALNTFKNVIALVLFAMTILVMRHPLVPDITGSNFLLLLASGAIGIAISDTLLFMTLNRLGGGIQAIVYTTYAPFVILLSVLFLGERLRLVQALGVVVVLVAVLWISRTRMPHAIARRDIVLGVVFGMLGTLTQAISVVMVKPMLDDMSLLTANLWRLIGGLAGSAIFFAVSPSLRRTLVTLGDRKAWPVAIGGSVAGNYVALLFWLGGMKYTLASVASGLNQTSTLWTFLLAALILKEEVTADRLAALALGMAGVLAITLG